MASNPEYLRIVALTKDLQLSVRDQLTSLSLALVSKLLISPDAGSDLRNPMHSGADRAAKLVELLQRKVLEDAKHYHTFIRVLEEDGSEYHRVILGKLRQLTPTKKDHQDVPVDQVAIETNIGQSGLSRAGLHHRRKDKDTTKEEEVNSGSGVKVQFTRQESHSHISIPNGQLLTKACVVLLTLILCTLVTFGLGVAAYYKKSNIFPDSTSCTEIESPRLLFDELKEIGSWEHLCLNLRVGTATVNTLHHEHADNSHKKLRCLEAFYNEDTEPGVKPCWETVVKAVNDYPISNRRLAKDLAHKYNTAT